MRRLATLTGTLVSFAVVGVVIATPSSAPGAGETAPVKLHGVMRFKGNFVLKKGSRYLVTGKTTIVARGSVVIDAPIQVAPGGGLTIVARGIRNSAPIGPQRGVRRLASRTGGAGCPYLEPIVEVSFALGIEVDAPITGMDGTTAADGYGCPGQSVALVAVSSALQSQVIGNGGGILVAAATAGFGDALVAFAENAGGAALPVIGVLLSIPSGIIAVHAPVHAGNGGPGGTRKEGRGAVNLCRRSKPAKPPLFPPPGDTYVEGGPGGRGGDVVLETANIGLNGGIGTGSGTPGDKDIDRVDGFYVRPGKGGRGGSAGTRVAPVTAPDGGPREGGGSVFAWSGDGGAGGLSTLIEHWTTRSQKARYRAGEGGPPGNAFVRAGNGGLSNCDGGDAFVKIGDPGTNGHIPGEGSPKRPEPEPAVVGITGGNGNPGPSTEASDRAGGFGGDVWVYDVERKAAYVKIAGIDISSAGNGGLGFDGCPTGSAGGAGGEGGDLSVLRVLSDIKGSFNGGNGNQGVGPGAGGIPGGFREGYGPPAQLELIKGSFRPGKPGGNCPQVGVRITESDTWAHNASIGKSNVCLNVGTTPPQSFVSGELTGPGGFDEKTNGEAPLHPDGSAQIRATITQAGDYTDTLKVYDKNGNQTATSTHTFTVAPPPQDGPPPTFGPSCPAPTS